MAYRRRSIRRRGRAGFRRGAVGRRRRRTPMVHRYARAGTRL